MMVFIIYIDMMVIIIYNESGKVRCFSAKSNVARITNISTEIFYAACTVAQPHHGDIFLFQINLWEIFL